MESMNRSLDRYNQASSRTAATLGVPRHIQNAGWYLAPTSSEEATNGSRELDDSMQEQNTQPQNQEHQNVNQDLGVAQESQQEQSDNNVQITQHEEPIHNVDPLAEQQRGSPAREVSQTNETTIDSQPNETTFDSQPKRDHLRWSDE